MQADQKANREKTYGKKPCNNTESGLFRPSAEGPSKARPRKAANAARRDPAGKTDRWPQRPQRKARGRRPQPHQRRPAEASTAVRVGTRVGRTAEETSATRAKQLEKATSCLVPGSSTELADRYKKPNKTKLEPLKGIRGSSPLGTRFRRGDLHLYKLGKGGPTPKRVTLNG